MSESNKERTQKYLHACADLVDAMRNEDAPSGSRFCENVSGRNEDAWPSMDNVDRFLAKAQKESAAIETDTIQVELRDYASDLSISDHAEALCNRAADYIDTLQTAEFGETT